MGLRFLLFALGQMTVAAVIAATAWAAGTMAGRALRMSWALAMAVGFALIAQAFLLVGMVGMLRKPVVLAIVIGVHVAAIPAWRHIAAARWESQRQLAPTVRATAVTFGLALAAVPAFLLTLYPPLGFDQTMYHLPYARAFAASGAVPFLPALRFPIFPQLVELVNAAVLMFAGDVATQATGFVALVACLGLAYTWARELASDGGRASDGHRLTGSGSDSRTESAGGWLAVAIIAGSPIAVYLSASGYVEPLLALFIAGALYAADRARIERSHWRWLIAAGFLAGSAAGVKYLGLYTVPAAAILIVSPRAPWRVTLRDLAIFGAAAALALLPTYARLVAHTGNPLFPFYPELFGASPWTNDVLMGARGAERWSLAVTRLWDVTFRRELIGGMPHYSPAFVFSLPVIVCAAWRYHQLRRLLLIALGYVLIATTHAHHLFAIAVLWSALAGASAALLLRARARLVVLIALAVVLAAGGEAYAMYRLNRLGVPPVTTEGRDRLLAAQRPLYPAIAWLNRTAGPVTVYAIHAEMMVDYANGTLLGDFNGPASFDRMEARVRGSGSNSGSVASALDAIGASYLLVPEEEFRWNALASSDPRLARIYHDDRASIYRRIDRMK